MDNAQWATWYRANKNALKNKVAVKVMTSDNKHFFFHDYYEWFIVKEHCNKNRVKIKDFHLNFRSNRCMIDVEDSDGFYFIRSALGQPGKETKLYFTIGVLRNGIVKKKMYLLPELLKEKEYEDELENCFDEAMIYYETKKANRQK